MGRTVTRPGSRAKRGAALFGVLAIAVVWGLSPGGWAQDSAKSKDSLEKAFPSSNKCKRCHERVFEEWEASPLSRSIHSPTFRAALEEYLTFSGGKDKGLC